MVYEWNAAKASANSRKHGVSFDRAATVFLDPDHSSSEEREITIGDTAEHQVVFVSHCQRGDRVRIIGARKATRTERRQYEAGIGKEIG